MRNWKRKRGGLDLEAELRANRPEPSRAFVHRIEARVREGRRSRVGSLRVAFVGALTASLLAALASVGGLGYAATATGSAVEKVQRVVQNRGVLIVKKSPARDQYGPKKPKKAKKKAKVKKKAKGRRFARPPFTG
jgi:hypothetical protein